MNDSAQIEVQESPRRGNRKPHDLAGRTGRYVCTRCGWRWDPDPGKPDPPKSCAFCHSSYWDRTPTRFHLSNTPDNPKWQTLRRDTTYKRKQARHRKKFAELAAELGPEAIALAQPTLRDHLVAEKLANLEDLRVRNMEEAAPVLEPEPLIPPPPGLRRKESE